DVVHTLPVVDLLKLQFPNVKITWVAEKTMSPLLRHHPNIDQLLLVDTRTWRKRIFSPGVWKEVYSFLRYLRWLEFDIAIDFQGLFKSAVLARISGARRRVGMSRYDRNEQWTSVFLNEFGRQTARKRHIIEKNLALLETLGIKPNNQPLNFHIHP